MKSIRLLLVLAYPFLVYAALSRFEPRWVALAFACVVVLRAAMRWQGLGRLGRQALGTLLLPVGIGLAVIVVTWLSGDPLLLLLVPAFANGALLFSFGRTLLGGPSFIETVARLQHPDLSDAEVRHCVAVTWMWCAFFLVNGGICAALALAGEPRTWALYTGLVSYVLVGLLFAVEFVVRSWRFGRYEGTLLAPLFRRLFPRNPAT